MSQSEMRSLIGKLPRPIAWALSDVDRSLDPVRRFICAVKMVEETIQYAALVVLARYLDLRDTKPDPLVEAQLQHLRRPTLGDWTSMLDALDRHVAKVDSPVFGRPLSEATESPGIVAMVNRLDGKRRHKATISQFIRGFPTLRNSTVGHGSVRDTAVSDWTAPLLDGVFDLVALAPLLVSRPPVYVREIKYVGPRRYLVEYLTLVGTGRPLPSSREVADPGILQQQGVYLWDDEGSAPLLLSPLAHFDPVLEAMFLLSSIKAGVPQYASIQCGELTRQPDNLTHLFEERAAFLLEAPAPVPTVGRAPAAREHYIAIVRQVLADGVVTTDERQILEVARTSMGLSESEAGTVHEDLGLAEAPTSPKELSIPIPDTSNTGGTDVPPPKAPENALPTSQPRNAARERAHARAREMDLSDDIDGAIAAYRNILHKDPDDDEARDALSKLLLELSDHAGAEAICREGLSARESALLHAALAHVLADANRDDEACEQAEKALRLDPTCVPALLELVTWCIDQGQVDEARRHLDAATKAAPEDPHVIGCRSDYAEELGESPVTGLQQIQRALRSAPRNRRIRFTFISKLLAVDLVDDAIREAADLLRRSPRWHQAVGLYALVQWHADRVDEALKQADAALAMFPGSLLGLFARAVALAKAGRGDEARATIDRIRKVAPRMPAAGFIIALCFLGMYDLTAAERELRRVLALNPQYAEARLMLSAVLADTARNEEALRQAMTVVERFPEDRDARIRAGMALLNLERIDEAASMAEAAGDSDDANELRALVQLAQGSNSHAATLLDSIIRRTPDREYARYLLMECLRRLGRFDEAMDQYRQAPEHTARMTAIMALLCTEAGDVVSARGLLEEVKDAADIELEFACEAAINSGATDLARHFVNRGLLAAPRSASMRFWNALLLDNTGDWDEALREYQRVLDIEPTHVVALNNLGFLAQAHGRLDFAIECFRRARGTEAGKASSTLRHNLALALYQQGMIDEAKAEARAALEIDDSESAYNALASALREAGALEPATAWLAEGLSTHPGSVELRRTSSILLTRQGRCDDALKVLREAERLDPLNALVQQEIANLLFILGRTRQAAVIWKRASDLAPDNPEIVAGLGEFLLRQGDFPGARKAMQRLRELAPQSDWVAGWYGAIVETSQYQDGLALVRELRTFRPDDPLLTLAEGACLLNLGVANEALPFLEMAQGHYPGVAGWELGNCLMALGRPEEALDVLERARHAEPNLPIVRRGLVRCLSILGEKSWAEEELAVLLQLEPDPADADELRQMVAGLSESPSSGRSIVN